MALFSCLLITPWVKRLAFAVSAVDQPGEHRVSRIPVARLGGLAIYLTLVVTFLLAGVGLDLLLGRGTRIAALIVAASTVLILGLIDDRLPLTPSFKLVVEVLAASVAVLAGYRIRSVV